MNDYSEKGLLPAGLADMLPPAAAREARINRTLMDVFAGNGYLQVKPPLIEFEEHLLEGSGAALASKMFRVMDPVSHRMMGIRTDITLQIARVATTRMKQDPRPLRLSYSGQVLRVHGSQLRPERQFAQTGVELIGPSETSADAELILLAAEALNALEVENFSIDLTLPTLVPTICRELGIDEKTAVSARESLDHKDAAALDDYDAPLSQILITLLKAAGPASTAIEALEKIKLPDAAAAQVDALKKVVAQLRQSAPDLKLTIDPGEYRGFEYQTGLSFTVFGRGVRGELGRGGRYRLMDGESASGFTLFLDSLMRAVPRRPADDRLYLPFGTGLDQGYALRQEGWKTVAGLAPEDNVEAEAKRLQCGQFLGPDGITKLS
ncbi:ATP phosphoribosyltransferase regulatory subunit [Sneathiella sp. CAU 1612]|uniref:ATP phosphoribosyltransferase regulatory subunit n=1 Tax=Sneathiella sedimenti TaxID=2816034 RepID=A0ABS3F4I5_9PROT|nr:ATP phosphoribosyltransferase regulatory subunit [Sneathiella sedimenti]MBO0333438.1 ATP phosphoribosyltransferase regulatory subunit [Sneathiella sedimenti]